MPPYRLFITNKNYSSWSLRIWLLMRAASIPFEETLVPMTEEDTQTAFFAFSPTGKVPCLHDIAPPDDNDAAGALVVNESVAIAEYLAERHPGAGIWPADMRARAWARAAVAEMASGFGELRRLLSFSAGVRVKLGEKELEGKAGRELKRVQELWSEGLGRFGGPWLAGGEFGAVDAFYAPIVVRFQTFGVVLGEEARGYYERVLGREEVKEWIQAGVEETWRDGGHEWCTMNGREVLADYRKKA